MADAHANFAASLVATAPSPATSGTSLVVTAADGAKLPAVPFNATICPAATAPTTSNAEIVRVTAKSTDTLTITRAQEGTTARTVVVGDQIFAGITAKTLTDVEFDYRLAASPGGNSYETFPRYSATNTTTAIGSSGKEFIFGIVLPAGLSVGHISMVSGGTALASSTNYWFALSDSSRVLLAVTADQTTTAWPTFTVKSLAIATTAAGSASSFTTTYAGLYYLSIMVAATTVPTLMGVAATSTLIGLSPTLGGGVTIASGLTTPPAFPRTATTPGTGGGIPYAYVGA